MSSPTIQRAVRLESVALLYRNQQRTLGFTLLGCLVVSLLLHPHVPRALLLPWMAVAVLVNVLRYVDVRRRLRAADFGHDPVADERRSGLLIAISSAVLGIPMAVYFPALTMPEQYALGLMSVALCAGATASFIASRTAFFCYSVPLLALTAVGHLRCAVSPGTDGHYVMVVVLAAYGAGIGMVHGWLRGTVQESMALRYEKETMLREKEALLIRLEMDNAELLADRDAFLIESLTDGLTGLANRRHFDKTLRRDWDRARREGMSLSCIMLDVDHFKPYNDKHGHAAGDMTLQAVGETLTACLNRGSDFAARYGGEEFVILLPGTDLEGSALLAERIRKAIEKMSFTPRAQLTISAGVASLTPAEAAGTAERLLELADDALYRAKAEGRNRVVTNNGSALLDGRLPDPA